MISGEGIERVIVADDSTSSRASPTCDITPAATASKTLKSGSL
jgi:hypothetical protein